MMTVREVFNHLGGTHSVASLLSVSTQAVCNMRSRDAIPPRHWPALIEEANRRKLRDINLKNLAALNTRSSKPEELVA